jgi:Xaa-Pro aminopeptidase
LRSSLSSAKESGLNTAVYDAAKKDFGIIKHWHKRVVRSGKNTLAIFHDNPPDLVIQEDDIVFIDLGPVFEEWEADFGRTFVLGNDSQKHRLKADLSKTFIEVEKYFSEHPDVTGAELFAFAQERATNLG